MRFTICCAVLFGLVKTNSLGIVSVANAIEINNETSDPWKQHDDIGSAVETLTIVENSHEVVQGENMWAIAEYYDPENVHQYWLKLIELNRQSLISKNPNLIYPKEQLKLN